MPGVPPPPHRMPGNEANCALALLEQDSSVEKKLRLEEDRVSSRNYMGGGHHYNER